MSELTPFDGELAPLAGAVDSVSISVPTVSLEDGTTGSASATVIDALGNRLAGRTVTWSSSVDAVVADPSSSVTNALGVATVPLPALSAGTTSIKATCEGVDSAEITVTVVAVAPPDTYAATGATTIEVVAVDRLAAWSKPRPRRFNDADQKKRFPGDRFLEGLEATLNQPITWPRKELQRRFAK